MTLQKVILKADKEKSLIRRHPWIFSGAIASLPSCEPGTLLPVYSASGDFLAQAYFHPDQSLCGRVLSFEEGSIEEILFLRIEEALNLRKAFFDRNVTNAYRLINAEGDGLPGLIVDCYDDVLVIQANTYGIERLKPLIVKLLKQLVSPRTIYEKSSSFSRRQEGLQDQIGLLFGEEVDLVQIKENGMGFFVSIKEGQKTGFFLDQREMRQLVAKYAKDKRVLNCFSYSGGFSLFALKSCATHVVSVDSCQSACSLAYQNTTLNGFDHKLHTILQKDVFEVLKSDPLDYDLIILDPPAFAKKRGDLLPACNAYKEMNRMVFQKVKAGTLILSSSCSYHVDEELFQNLLFQAASSAHRSVKILGRHIQALDHPISLNHKEGEYLKSLLLYVQ
jgi:23S rRNA (cytosine1962-C5)-methyltransferase